MRRAGRPLAFLLIMALAKARDLKKRFLLSKILTAVGLYLLSPLPTASASERACHEMFSSRVLPWFQKTNFSETERVLAKGKIAFVVPLKEALKASGKTDSGTQPGLALVTFTDGSQAIWKPGEWNLFEETAYQLAKEVGFKLIPPTVYRTLDRSSFSSSLATDIVARLIGQSGSLQTYVPTPFDLMKMPPAKRRRLFDQVPLEQRAERDIFNFVFANWDLHWGNILVDESYSLVQIDNGVFGYRQMVRYGELPFLRRLSYSAEVKRARAGSSHEPFPFDQAVLLKDPSIDQFVELVRDYADPKELEKYAYDRGVRFKDDNLSMRVAFWDDGIWIQAIGFQNYDPIVPPVFPRAVLDSYRRLNFERLRILLPSKYSDEVIREMLDRRDQIMAAAAKTNLRISLPSAHGIEGTD